ncbi:MAG: response regulator [Myxococcota bacterium]|nr:response regulator [Myxococcota bacterium]
MRNIVFRFDDASSLLRALREGDRELPVPTGGAAADGEWVLSVFEVAEGGRATAAAARAVHRGVGAVPVISFEERDWERLVEFANAGVGPAALSSTPPDRPTLQSVSGRPGPSNENIVTALGSLAPAHPTSVTFSNPFTQGPNARVLVVDDDQDIRDVITAMLHAVGLVVESAISAEEALERVRAQSFDLLLLDWNLPGMTGIELCRLIRRDRILALLPVLFLTAHASSRDVVEAFASGADDYVVKPFRAPELGARIFGLLRRARMSRTAQVSP